MTTCCVISAPMVSLSHNPLRLFTFTRRDMGEKGDSGHTRLTVQTFGLESLAEMLQIIKQ